jgi:site-specific DNA recombinase
MKTAAIYARVSSGQQKQDKTITSQTAALMAFASSQGYSVPAEWLFEDEGFSGATLVRPGLDRVRDLAAEGQIQAVLVLSPDRLSRKYSYQVLLAEEWLRCGVQTIFVNAPSSQRPEDPLLLQFQGMIAEYERAQILERSRRGKRHRAQQGEISVLSGAPYGYRYVRKTEERAAYYEVLDAQAAVVRQIFELYTAQALSIGAITRRLNELGIPTQKEKTPWERSTIWAMLRNPAYRGMACFGKTQQDARWPRANRAVRLRGHALRRSACTAQPTPQDQWIQIPVPALVDERTFDLAQERLQDNKKFSPRRTLEPSILQGLAHCAQCGYALYRTSTRSSARKIDYYRCLGSHAWRYQGQARCSARPIRHSVPHANPSRSGSAGSVDAPDSGDAQEGSLLRTWREWSTLWGTHLARLHMLTDQHPGAQVAPDQAQQSLVGNGSPQQVHQYVMVDGVEELGQINVHCDASAVLHYRLYLPDRLVCIAAWSKAETRFRECRLEDRREHLAVHYS